MLLLGSMRQPVLSCALYLSTLWLSTLWLSAAPIIVRRIQVSAGGRSVLDRASGQTFLVAPGHPSAARNIQPSHQLPGETAGITLAASESSKTGHSGRAGDHRLYRLPSDELVRACSSNGFCSLPGGGYFHHAFYGFLERRHRGREGETDELFAGRTKGGSGNCGDAGVLKQDAA